MNRQGRRSHQFLLAMLQPEDVKSFKVIRRRRHCLLTWSVQSLHNHSRCCPCNMGSLRSTHYAFIFSEFICLEKWKKNVTHSRVYQSEDFSDKSNEMTWVERHLPSRYEKFRSKLLFLKKFSEYLRK